MIVGARFWLVHHYAASLPLSDQWDAEGWNLLKPWQEGHRPLSALFSPHNEHRILLTRTETLGLFLLSGQWSPLLEMTVNALLAGLTAVAIAAVLLQSFDQSYRPLILSIVSLSFLLPFGWENIVGGFQSSSYFLVGFSLLALWGLGLNQPLSAAWWVGLIASILACLAVGSGCLAAGCVLVLLFVRAWKSRRCSLAEGVTAAICAVIVLSAWLTTPHVPASAPFRVQTTWELLVALGRFFAWPLPAHPWMSLWMIAPVAVLAVAYWHAPGRRSSYELLLLTGAWYGLQVLALAYYRGGHQAPPASRYTDVLVIGLMASFFSLLMLGSRLSRGPLVGLLVVWASPIVIGLTQVTDTNFAIELPAQLEHRRIQETNIRSYLETGDADRYLIRKLPSELPYPDTNRLRMMLDDSTMRSLLLSNASDFRKTRFILKQGEIIFTTGLALMLALLVISFLQAGRVSRPRTHPMT